MGSLGFRGSLCTHKWQLPPSQKNSSDIDVARCRGQGGSCFTLQVDFFETYDENENRKFGGMGHWWLHGMRDVFFMIQRHTADVGCPLFLIVHTGP